MTMNRLFSGNPGRALARAALLALLCAAGPALADVAGKIAVLEGKADVMRGSAAAVALKLGDPVQEGDILRTKRKSRLEIELKDGSRVRMSALSRLEITKFLLGEKPDSLMVASRGQVRAIVTDAFSSRKDSFRMKTPTATVGVQGTDFSLAIEPLTTVVSVYSGVVSVENLLPEVVGRQLVTAGFSVKVQANQPPSAPQSFGGGGPGAGPGGGPGGDSFGVDALVPITPTPFEGPGGTVRPPAK